MSPHLAGCRLSQGDQKFICLFVIPATKGHLSAVPWHWATAATLFNCVLSLPHHLGQSTSAWLNLLTVWGSPFLFKINPSEILWLFMAAHKQILPLFPSKCQECLFYNCRQQKSESSQCLCAHAYGKKSNCDTFVRTPLAGFDSMQFKFKQHFDQTWNPNSFLPWWLIKTSRFEKE